MSISNAFRGEHAFYDSFDHAVRVHCNHAWGKGNIPLLSFLSPSIHTSLLPSSPYLDDWGLHGGSSDDGFIAVIICKAAENIERGTNTTRKRKEEIVDRTTTAK